MGEGGKIIVLEPRRIAARAAPSGWRRPLANVSARRVGYRVRMG